MNIYVRLCVIINIFDGSQKQRLKQKNKNKKEKKSFHEHVDILYVRIVHNQYFSW